MSTVLTPPSSIASMSTARPSHAYLLHRVKQQEQQIKALDMQLFEQNAASTQAFAELEALTNTDDEDTAANLTLAERAGTDDVPIDQLTRLSSIGANHPPMSDNEHYEAVRSKILELKAENLNLRRVNQELMVSSLAGEGTCSY